MLWRKKSKSSFWKLRKVKLSKYFKIGLKPIGLCVYILNVLWHIFLLAENKEKYKSILTVKVRMNHQHRSVNKLKWKQDVPKAYPDYLTIRNSGACPHINMRWVVSAAVADSVPTTKILM